MNTFVYGAQGRSARPPRWRDALRRRGPAAPRRARRRAAAQRDVRLMYCVLAGPLDPLLQPRRPGRAGGQARRRGRAWACARSGCSSTTSRRSSSTPRTGRPSPTSPRPTSAVVRARRAPAGPGPGARRLPDRLLGPRRRGLPGHGWARASTRAWTCSGPGRAICSPTLDLDDARRLRDRDRPAAAVLGQLPRQRRGHELRAAHRARTAAGTRAWPRARAGSSPTAWSCSRRRRSRSPRSRTTSRPRRLRPRGELGSGDPATSSARRTRRPSRCSRTTCARRA